MLYLDTSALLKLHVREAESAQVETWVTSQDDPLLFWEIQEMELTNALHLKVFWGELNEDEAARQLERMQDRKRRGLYWCPEIDRSRLMRTFRELTVESMTLGCRTFDVLHVACALQFSAITFVSFDARQNTLAERAGLVVVGAGTGS